MFLKKLGLFAALSAAAATLGAQTTTMDFATLKPYADYAVAPQTLGDHANLNVTSSTRSAFGNSAQTYPGISMWNTGYSSLAAVGFAYTNNAVGELAFTPGAGKQVTLSNLFVGAYYQNLAMTVKVFDAGWNEIFDFSGTINAAQQLFPNVTSAQGLYLQWGANWNTGVNLIETTVSDVATPPTTTAPEPASIVLVGSGLGIVALLRRRRTRAA